MPVVDLAGPKGYTHGWVYHGTAGMSAEDMANRMSHNIAGRNMGRTQAHGAHLLAAQAHRKAAALSSSPDVSSYHTRMAAHHARMARVYRLSGDAGMNRRIRTAKSGWMKAIGDYDRAIASGTTKFTPAGFAKGGASQKASDRDLMNFVRQHVHQMSGQPGRTVDMSTYAHAKPGSGKNFAKLKGALASRGAHSPGALAAWIGRRKYGRKGFAKLGHKDMTAGQARQYLLAGARLDYVSSGSPGPAALRTPAGGLQSSTGFGPNQIGVASGRAPGASLAGGGGTVVELARRLPAGPSDVIVSRDSTGRAVIRHRLGATTIGRLYRNDAGKFVSALGEDGPELSPHTHQRAALAELLGTYNQGTTTPFRRAAEEAPLQPAPQQTALMERFGIPAVRAFATPTAGVSDGPRVTGSAAGSGGPAGLSPKGVSIYQKLIGKGFPRERALAFARRAQDFGSKGS